MYWRARYKIKQRLLMMKPHILYIFSVTCTTNIAGIWHFWHCSFVLYLPKFLKSLLFRFAASCPALRVSVFVLRVFILFKVSIFLSQYVIKIPCLGLPQTTIWGESLTISLQPRTVCFKEWLGRLVGVTSDASLSELIKTT